MTGNNELPQTTDLAFLIIADPHLGQTNHVARVQTCLDWGLAQTPAPMAIYDAGDSNHAEMAALLASEYPAFAGAYRKVLGNHDSDYPIDCPSGTVSANPFAGTIAALPYFGGNEWWSHDMRTLDDRATHVRVVGLQNNSPSWNPIGVDNYYNCNPPGVQNELNHDHTGLTDPNSAQRIFLEAAIQTAPDWCIVLAHRGWLTARDEHPRPLAHDTEFLLAYFEAWGVSLVASGDIHVGSYTRAPGKKLRHLCLSGGYATRAVVDTAVPEGSILWASGASVMNSGLCQIAYLNINNDSVALHIFECSDANPEGGVVYTDTFTRNGGVAGGLEG